MGECRNLPHQRARVRLHGFTASPWPSIPDLFFAALLVALFGHPGSWQSLLFDGDTGWHIRTGQLILQSGAVPRHDPFSLFPAGSALVRLGVAGGC